MILQLDAGKVGDGIATNRRFIGSGGAHLETPETRELVVKEVDVT